MSAILAEQTLLFQLVETLGWTLLHFLWQGLAVAIVVYAALLVARNLSSTIRYSIALVGLAVMAACPVLTFCFLQQNSAGLHQHVASASVLHSEQTALPDSNRDLNIASSPIGSQSNDGAVGEPQWFDSENSLSLLWARLVQMNAAAIVIVWLSGVLLLSVRLLLSYRSTRTLRQSSLTPPVWITERAENLAGTLDVRSPLVRHSKEISQAIALGFFRPMIVLPTAWISELSPEMVENIIAHELVHIRRGDIWVNLLQRVVETLLFYHPAVWWISNRIRAERELCCDADVITATERPLKYAETLEFVGRLAADENGPGLAVASVGSKKLLLRRVRAVLGVPDKKESGAVWFAGLIPLVTILFVAGSITYGNTISRIAKVERSDMREGDTTSFEVRSPAKKEVDERDPFSVFGRVTDGSGNPIANATVRVATGIGTLIGGGSTTTDDEGKFKLDFGPGVKTTVNPETSPLGVGVQAAQFYVSKDGWKLNLEQGYLFYLMSDLTPKQFEKMLADSGGKVWGKSDSAEVVFAHNAKEVDFTLVEETEVPNKKETSKIIWGKSRAGLTAGAKLISATGELEPGDPIVVQFVLKNESADQTTVVLKRATDTHPVLGQENRLELNLTGSSLDKTKHTLEPGEILEDTRYRVTVSTAGMAPGEYRITSGSAFWMEEDGKPNQSTGIPFGKTIPFKLGTVDSKAPRQPPNDEEQKIHWGKPVGNLVMGMRLLDDRDSWPNNDVDIEGQLYLFNAGDKPIELTYELPPTPSDWSMHVTGEGNTFVRLDWTLFTGRELTRERKIKVAPGQSIPLTGIQGDVSTGGKEPVDTLIKGPQLRIVKDKTKFKYGDPKRLVDQSGQFDLHAAVTVRMKELADPVIVLSSAPVPFKVAQ